MGCSTINELGVNFWTEELLHRIGHRRFPLNGVFELTDRCNLGCVHCYINQSVLCQAARESELSTDQVKEILNQVAEAGCLHMTFTGGEVLLRPDFTEIYLHARRLGMLVTVFTNGTLLTPRIADVLTQSRPKRVEISLYGGTRETYEQVTGVPGSYDRCIRGIELLLKQDINLTLKTIVLTLNFHEIELMRSMAQQYGLDFRYDGNLWPRLDGGSKPYEYRLSLEQILSLDEGSIERQREWKRITDEFGGTPKRAEYVFRCAAGLWSFHINSSARLSICTMVRQPSFDLHQLGFAGAWEKIGELRQLKRVVDNKCRDCTLGAICNQCPGWSQMVHGDNETPVDFVCDLAHMRADLVKKSII